MNINDISGNIVSLFNSTTKAKTDFAVMLSGEWGIGKTFYLKNTIMPELKKIKLRPIYISLIGLNSEEKLEKILLKSINPLQNSSPSGSVAKDAELIKAIIDGKMPTNILVPQNIVLCFDDLERVNPQALELIMGYINTFIEHYNTRTLILCNENALPEKSFFSIIKEKFIRFTFNFVPPFKDVIISKISSYNFHPDYYINHDIFSDTFKKANIYNIRTLDFALFVYKKILENLTGISIEPTNRHEILDSIQFYCCFYSIEIKKGTKPEILDKISIANNADILSSWLLANEKEKQNSNNKTSAKNESAKPDYSKIINAIQDIYFGNFNKRFTKFESIAGFIKTSYIDRNLLKVEIETLNNYLNNISTKDHKTTLINSLSNIYEFDEAELLTTIEKVIAELETGKYDLHSYLKIFRELLWIELNKIQNYVVSPVITERLKKGIQTALKEENLTYISNFDIQFYWDQKDKSEFRQRYQHFVDYVREVNDQLAILQVNSKIELLIDLIKSDTSDKMSKVIYDTSFAFSLEDAQKIFDTLKIATNKTIHQFTNALNTRYQDDGRIISQVPRIESDFINQLIHLLDSEINEAGKKFITIKDANLKLLRDTLANFKQTKE